MGNTLLYVSVSTGSTHFPSTTRINTVMWERRPPADIRARSLTPGRGAERRDPAAAGGCAVQGN